MYDCNSEPTEGIAQVATPTTNVPPTSGEATGHRSSEGFINYTNQDRMMFDRFQQQTPKDLILAFPESAGPDLRAIFLTIKTTGLISMQARSLLDHLAPGSGTVYAQVSPHVATLISEILDVASVAQRTPAVVEIQEAINFLLDQLDLDPEIPTVAGDGETITIDESGFPSGILDEAQQPKPSIRLGGPDISFLANAFDLLNTEALTDTGVTTLIDEFILGAPRNEAALLDTDPRLFAFLIDLLDYAGDQDGLQSRLLHALNEWGRLKDRGPWDTLDCDGLYYKSEGYVIDDLSVYDFVNE